MIWVLSLLTGLTIGSYIGSLFVKYKFNGGKSLLDDRTEEMKNYEIEEMFRKEEK